MSQVINLNQARKARARIEAKSRAAENRVVHGRTKAEKQVADRERERAERLLDGSKRED